MKQYLNALRVAHYKPSYIGAAEETHYIYSLWKKEHREGLLERARAMHKQPLPYKLKVDWLARDYKAWFLNQRLSSTGSEFNRAVDLIKFEEIAEHELSKL